MPHAVARELTTTSADLHADKGDGSIELPGAVALPSSVAPQARALRCAPSAARTPSAVDDLADAVSVIAGHLGEADPMLSAQLCLALAQLARRIDRIYEYLAL